MDNLSNPSVIWFILGFVLLLLEFALPGLVLFFFAAGAWLVAILCLFLDIPINIQLLIFAVTSVVTVSLLRKWLKKLIWRDEKRSSFIDDEFIGKTAKVERTITPSQNGKVAFRGTSWDACADEVIEVNENVLITETNSIVLKVKPIK